MKNLLNATNLRNLTITIGGLICAMILNHFNTISDGFNLMTTLGVGLFLSVTAFGLYLLVNEK